MPLSKNYKFKEGTKRKLWFELYTDPANEDTFLDHLESAIQAGYDCEDREHFLRQGGQNVRELKKLIDKKLIEANPAEFIEGRPFKWITLSFSAKEFEYLEKRAKLYDSTIAYIIKVILRRGIAWEKQFDD